MINKAELTAEQLANLEEHARLTFRSLHSNKGSRLNANQEREVIQAHIEEFLKNRDMEDVNILRRLNHAQQKALSSPSPMAPNKQR